LLKRNQQQGSDQLTAPINTEHGGLFWAEAGDPGSGV
jgi:hypothetical protein